MYSLSIILKIDKLVSKHFLLPPSLSLSMHMLHIVSLTDFISLIKPLTKQIQNVQWFDHRICFICCVILKIKSQSEKK